MTFEILNESANRRELIMVDGGVCQFHLLTKGKRRGQVITSVNDMCLIQPFLISYYGNGQAHDVSDPLPTLTARDRFGLVEPIPAGAAIDIRLRMLQPSELAGAHSFPADYQFAGSREDVVKQVGNSWPVGLGTAIIGEML